MSAKRRLGTAFWIATGWLVVVVFGAIFARLFFPRPDILKTTDAGQGPSWRHPFGTSKIGHDLLGRAFHGARLVVIIAVVAVLVGLMVGGIAGLVAGYFRGKAETVILTLLDAWIALPSLMVLLAVVTYISRAVWVIAFAVGLLTVPLFARVVRTAVLSVVDRPYVDAARAAGARSKRIIVREIIPNVAIPVASYACLVAGLAVVIEGSMSYLGVGLDIRRVSWGQMVLDGQRDLERFPYISLIPAALFVATVLALNLVGDRLAARSVVPVVRVKSLRQRSSVAAARGRAPIDTVMDLVDVRTSIATFAGAVRAVDGVTLSLRRGRTLAVVGESGSGKTMLARSILDVLPPAATTTGQVWLGDRDLRGLSVRELRQVRGRRVAMVFQDPGTALDPVMKVGDQIIEMLRVHRRLSRRTARLQTVALLDDMGVADPTRRANQYAHELSGGQRQRVAIALALSCEPEVLIADEPTSALDVTIQAQILDLLQDQQASRGLAVLLITHDLGVVATRADEIAVMYAGRVVEHGDVRHLFTYPSHPYTQALLAAMPRLDRSGRLQPIAGQPPDLMSEITGCAFAPRCPLVHDRCRTETPLLVGKPEHRVACWARIKP